MGVFERLSSRYLALLKSSSISSRRVLILILSFYLRAQLFRIRNIVTILVALASVRLELLEVWGSGEALAVRRLHCSSKKYLICAALAYVCAVAADFG